MASVQVLCPNGHRVNIKITPSTTILQILEEACVKKDFLPAEHYELKHGRNILDVTQSVRYSGLTNLAKLELVKASKPRAESSVTVALQLASGERRQHDFIPNTSLWQILTHWETTQDDKVDNLTRSPSSEQHPVCIYMRDEIIGECALKHTTLRSLGLTGGKVIIRFLFRAVDENTLKEINVSISKKQSLYQKMNEASTSKSSDVEKSRPTHCKTQTNVDAISMKSTSSTGQETNATASGQDVESMDTDSGSYPATGSAESVSVDAMDTDSIAETAQTDPLDQLNRIPGVEVTRPGQAVTGLSRQEQQMVHAISQSVLPQLSGENAKTQTVNTGGGHQSTQPINQFKFPESTKGKDLYQNELSEATKDDYKPCDRETVVFDLDEKQEHDENIQEDDIPDNFFEVTEGDLRKRMHELSKNVEMFGEAALMTSSMRRAQLDQKMDRYQRCVIRIHFPDRKVLQAVFRPRETVHALTKFVRDNLEDKQSPFYLYTTPPRCVLKDNSQMLGEADLMPMAVVHFGSEITKDVYLSSSLFANKSSQLAADQIVWKIMSPAEDQSKERIQKPTGSAVKRSEPSHKSPPSTDGKKVPKWFNMGKK